jgi:hypothetical protein
MAKGRPVFCKFALAGKAKPRRFLKRSKRIFAENTAGGVDKVNQAST